METALAFCNDLEVETIRLGIRIKIQSSGQSHRLLIVGDGEIAFAK